MTQEVFFLIDGKRTKRTIPNSSDTVLPGVVWGEPWVLFTPSYWLSQIWMHKLEKAKTSPYKTNGSLAEEIVFCILGGHGITAEVSYAYFQSCKEAGLISNLDTSTQAWSEQLRKPLKVGNGILRYRYPNKKAEYLVSAIEHIKSDALDLSSGLLLRNSLLKIKGVGLKTASWIARNYMDCDDVAILDIHLIRAGLLCNLFESDFNITRDYMKMEDLYVQFSRSLQVRPAVLDCLIWDQMRSLGKLPIEALKQRHVVA